MLRAKTRLGHCTHYRPKFESWLSQERFEMHDSRSMWVALWRERAAAARWRRAAPNTAGHAMARRHAGKASPIIPLARDRGRRSKAKAVTPESRSRSVWRCLNVNGMLCEPLCEREESRVRKLERRHAQVRDRISWALDSLQAFSKARAERPDHRNSRRALFGR